MNPCTSDPWVAKPPGLGTPVPPPQAPRLVVPRRIPLLDRNLPPAFLGGPQLLEAKFDRNPEGLGLFLVQVAEFVQQWGSTFPDEAGCIGYLGSQLEGQAHRIPWLRP